MIFAHDHGSKTNHIFFKLYYASEKFYPDKTGRFPIKYSRENKYVVIVYEYNYNHIHREPIKYCNTVDLTRA